METDRADSSRPRFLCDAMLGSLARWLRLFGFDAEYPAPGVDDRDLAERARTEGRWLLTRDRELAGLGPKTMLVRSAALDDQLVEVLSRLGQVPPATLDGARCAECNGELEDRDRAEIVEAVPPHVLRTAERFRRCSGCARVYWPGSHGAKIVARMERVVARIASAQ